jgi:hypothetical protein
MIGSSDSDDDGSALRDGWMGQWAWIARERERPGMVEVIITATINEPHESTGVCLRKENPIALPKE